MKGATMDKFINIGEKRVKMACNALLPRLYRYHFGRDLIVEMKRLSKAYHQTGTAEDGTPIYEIDDSADFSVAEQIAWLMLKAGGEDVGETIDEWLGTLESVGELYEIERAAFELWRQSEQTRAKPKKKDGRPPAK